MSDSMSKTEIEDVLSSIRRLVTEDHRPLQRPNAPPVDKLLLTPALRIEPALPEIRHPFGAAEPLRLGTAPVRTVQPPSTHRVAAALEAALNEKRDDWEPDGTDGASPNWSVEWDATDADLTETSDPAWPDSAVAEAAKPKPLSVIGPVVPDGNDATEDDVWDEFLAEHRSAPLLAAEQAEPWRPAQHRGEDRTADLSDALIRREARPTQPMVANGPTENDEVAADATPEEGDAARGSPPPHPFSEDQHEARLDEGLAVAVRPENAQSVDEEQLRDLIRDVLREELQGELGERITRNVRKLVRSELTRALTARDTV